MTAAAPPDPPARRAAPAARDVLERVFLSLRDLPRKLPRAPLRAALEDGMAALSLWGESPLHAENHLALLDRAAQRVGEAAALLRPAAEASPAAKRAARSLGKVEQRLRRLREETVDRIIADQDRMLRGPTSAAPAAAAPPPPFRAGVGAPSLHALPGRPKIAPPIEVEAPEADDDDEDDDAPGAAAGALPAAEAPAGPAYDEVAHVRRLARDCMEDIAIFGNLRRRNADERWVDVAPFEARLVANVDAFVSLGVVGPECERRADILSALMQWANPGFVDKGRAFACAFTLCCVEGEDTVRAAALALERAHPSTYVSYIDALSLSPNPAVRGAMDRLLGSADARLIGAALEVLRRRREASFGPLSMLLVHPEVEVVAAAARCLAYATERGPAITSLVRLVEEDVDDRTTLAAAASLLLLGAPEGLAPLRELLWAEREDPGAYAPAHVSEALRLLSLAGGPGDAALMINPVRPEEEGAVAAGWFGDPGQVPLLLDLLEIANGVSRSVGYPAPFEVRAAEALFRITGAPLRVEASRRPRTEVTTDLALDAAVWKPWWEEHGGRFAAGQKHRFGVPYTPLSSLEELSDDDAPADVRARCAFEVAVTVEGGARLDLDDWVARQRRVVDALRESASKGYAGGEWPANRLRGGGASPG